MLRRDPDPTAVPGAPSAPPESSLLSHLARRVRRLRRSFGWTRDTLARRSGLSVRFLARVESGEGNISVLRLEALARALGATPDLLVRPADERLPILSLAGLRGAGKSTIGPLLAARVGLPFVEMDDLIVESAGLPLDQLFELHDDSYYRKLEYRTLLRILDAGRPMVLAAAGGVVNATESWNLLCRRTTVVWLRAKPEDHWNRVVAQGDRRPMADNPDAMDELRAMLVAREGRYAEAEIHIDTSRIAVDTVVRRIAEQLPPTLRRVIRRD